MSALGGIRVREVTVTFIDGRQRTWTDVEWVRQDTSVLMQLRDGLLVEVPLHAVRLLEWRVAEAEEA